MIDGSCDGPHRRDRGRGCLKHQEPAVEPDGVGRGEPRVVSAEGFDELFLGTEGQPAHRGVRAVGADDEVGASRSCRPKASRRRRHRLAASSEIRVPKRYSARPRWRRTARRPGRRAGSRAWTTRPLPSNASTGISARRAAVRAHPRGAALIQSTAASASSRPIRWTTSAPAPRRSTVWPPGRMPGASSTTTTR